MAIPPSCTACRMFQQPGDLCRRHAPSPTTERQEVAQWPRREPDSRCGEGSFDPPLTCRSCQFWWQPGGKPLNPPHVLVGKHTHPFWQVSAPNDRGPEWWAQSGLCIHHTASPDRETRLYHPRVTHATLDGCGDGKVPGDD